MRKQLVKPAAGGRVGHTRCIQHFPPFLRVRWLTDDVEAVRDQRVFQLQQGYA